MNVREMSKQEFENLECFGPIDKFNSVVIVPTGEMHESGFMSMKFALVHHDDLVGCVGGWSDVMHLNGIGGYGKYDYRFEDRLSTQMAPVVNWCIDCLPCGLLRLFSGKSLSYDKMILSDFCLYVNE